MAVAKIYAIVYTCYCKKCENMCYYIAEKRAEIVLQCVAVCCRVLQCVAVCCSVLQCIAVRAGIVLQCVAVCCSASLLKRDS